MKTIFFTFVSLLLLNSAWALKPTETAPLPDELQSVGIDQSVLGSQLSMDTKFVDETGVEGELKDFFLPGKPALISVVYYDCPSLCGLHMNGAATLFEKFSLTAGKDFNWITITMDGTETPDLAMKKKIAYLDQFDVAGADEGWKFLTSTEENIKKITKEMSFSYKWDEKTKQFAHSSAFYVMTPNGKISQIIPGVGFEERTVRLALVQAAGGQIGNVLDQLLLFCFQFDATKNKYSPYIFNLMRIAGALTVLILSIVLIPMWRKEKFRGGNT